MNQHQGQRKIEYKIISETNYYLLESLVQILIDEGCQPLGGIAMTYDGNYIHYAQTMIKPAE